MSSFPHQPQVQRGFEPEHEGYIAPREQSPYLAALFKYMSAINAMDFDTITEAFDHKLVYSILPTSLQRPVIGHEMHLNYLDDITKMFIELRVNIHEVIEENQKIMAQLSVTGQGRSERRYENEIIFIIHFEKVSSRDLRKFGPNGGNWPVDALPKMVNVKEFVDSLRTKAWFKEERQWMRDNPQKVADQRRRRAGEWKKDRWRRRQSQSHGQGTSVGLPGQPTQYTQGPSPTSSHHQQVFPPPLSSRTSSRSQGQGQGQSPTSTRGYGPTSTSLGNPGQGYTYTLPSSGYPASYNPYNKDKY